ncbi:MAG: polysaccharide deacetylase [Synechococcales bacterium]|nr:polysaccharide deacetylase [Synechococcales bacterium]
MNLIWPEGVQCAAVFSFDIDGEAGMLQADQRNSERLSVLSWARYGPKVGVPRILDLLRKKEIRASFFVPGYTAELNSDLIKRIYDEGHEVGVHGYLHEKVTELNPAEEAAVLVKTRQILRDITGQMPLGYRAPWWDVHQRTPSILSQHGMLYDSSLMDDDRPYLISTATGNLVEIPVHWTNDDWEQFAFIAHPPMGSGMIDTCEKAFQLWKEEFDGIYHYGGAFVLTMHPEVIGRPARLLMLARLIDYVRSHDGVWVTTCGDIARYYTNQVQTRPEGLGSV